jgi:hypothetical protein
VNGRPGSMRDRKPHCFDCDVRATVFRSRRPVHCGEHALRRLHQDPEDDSAKVAATEPESRRVTHSKNPDSVTPAERDAEIASILARGVLCAVLATRARTGGPKRAIDERARSLGGGLERSPEAALSVATRPAGSRSRPTR